MKFKTAKSILSWIFVFGCGYGSAVLGMALLNIMDIKWFFLIQSAIILISLIAHIILTKLNNNEHTYNQNGSSSSDTK